MTDEHWRPVVGYEGTYEVSDRGRVRGVDRWIHYADGRRRLYRGQLMRPQPHPRSGHLTLRLVREASAQTAKVHALVMAAFVGPRPEGLEVCHRNGDPADNRLENLRYGSHGDNMYDSVTHGTHYESRRTHCPQRHPYDEVNTRHYRGRRYCRVCHKERRAA